MSSSPIIPSRSALASGFFQVGILGFGGVLPWARRMMVDQRHWMDDREFTELLGLGQLLPGPNIVNVAVVVGARFHGALGSLIAVAALMLAPMVIVLTLASLFSRYGHVPALQHALSGVSAAAAGLVFGMGIKLALKMERRYWTVALAGLTLAAIALWRLPLLWVLALAIPFGIACGYRSVQKEPSR
ncbi:chromate transporter [Chitinimonas sp.]|uniref:chromate transporter n=1 Tax=Chitinimonas sp. TaxID=1934313 RepID=UPI0035AFA17D